MPKTRNIAEVIRHKLTNDPNLAELVEQEYFNAEIAAEIFAMRVATGLTQKQFADRLMTHQSVVARLEDADYDGHSLKILRRIAEAFGKRLSVSFVNKIHATAIVEIPSSVTWTGANGPDWKPKIKMPPESVILHRPGSERKVS